MFPLTNLCRFLTKLEEQNVTVHLKMNIIIEGILDSADNDMNLHMKKVKYRYKKCPQEKLYEITIRGSTIQYILLPDNLSLDSILYEARLSYHTSLFTRLGRGSSDQSASPIVRPIVGARPTIRTRPIIRAGPIAGSTRTSGFDLRGRGSLSFGYSRGFRGMSSSRGRGRGRGRIICNYRRM